MAIESTGDSQELSDQKRRWRARATSERRKIAIDHQGFGRTLDRFLADSVPPGLRVVIYQAMGGEVDLAPLVARHGDPESRYAITRTPDVELALTVHPWGVAQERHRYGYDQPRIDSPVVDDADIGAVLVPALAFDQRGGRLGRGKGYYDRFLSRLSPACLRVGITGDYVVEQLPVGEHDVTMTHLAFSDRIVAL